MPFSPQWYAREESNLSIPKIAAGYKPGTLPLSYWRMFLLSAKRPSEVERVLLTAFRFLFGLLAEVRPLYVATCER